MDEGSAEHRPTPAWRYGHLFAGAALLVLGLALAAGFDYDPDSEQALLVGAFYALPLSVVALPVMFGTLYVVARLLGRTRVLVVPSALLAVIVAGYGYASSRPHRRFEQLVLDPAPVSLSDLRAEVRTSFNDGRAWLFAFRLAPADFPLLVARHHLTLHGNLPAPRSADAGGVEIVEIDRLDEPLRKSFPDTYRPPPNAEVYTGPRTMLVTDPGHSTVYLYLDRWDLPHVSQ